jgi:hypothetical protein
MSKLDAMAIDLSRADDLASKAKIAGGVLVEFPLEEINKRIKKHNDNGYQGDVGNGYRAMARMIGNLS